jgi:multiple sugar transport system permease protein/cellobiose transport system permease protein
LAKYQFKGRNVIYAFVLSTMMIPTQVSLIGYVLEMKSFGLINTLWPLILTFVATPFAAFFMTQFIKSAVPDEIIESARIDGCSEPEIFIKIVFPFIKPGTVTVAILVFLWSWNNYLLPLVSINDNSRYTIPLLISTLSSEFTTDFAAQMTAVGFAVIPIIILFAIGSRTFIEGLTAGAIKG